MGKRWIATLCTLGMIGSLGGRAQASAKSGASFLAGQHAAPTHAPLGYLGIDVRDVSEEQVGSLRLKDARGAEIIRVDHDGPAGKMGLREHDVVVQMNGTAIDDEEQIRRMLHETAPGRTIVLVISREGLLMTLTSQMADREQLERQAWQQHLVPESGVPAQAPQTASPAAEGGGAGVFAMVPGAASTSRYGKNFLGTLRIIPMYTGATLDRIGPQLAQFFGVPGGSGLLVRSVEENSPAAMAGLHAGDIVTRANLQPISTVSDWSKVIREAKGRPVAVTVLRDRQEKTLMLTPDGKRRSSLDLPVSAPAEVQMACRTEL